MHTYIIYSYAINTISVNDMQQIQEKNFGIEHSREILQYKTLTDENR